MSTPDDRPVLGTPHTRRWSASLAVVLVLLLQLALPGEVSLGPSWLVPLVQGLLLAPLVAANPLTLENDHPVLRTLEVAVAILVLATNTARLVHLIGLIAAGHDFEAGDLVTAAVIVLVTNIVAVAVVLWELDRGGPFARDPRHAREPDEPDLLYPQMTMPGYEHWLPSFLDYFFVAFTASTAFSPTDTMPLTRSAKVIFMLASATALVTIAVVAARAVNLV